ncbi:MAG: amino acid adenylation domain-containing protein [Acidobacteria bacterium]|nr:amino acid adenylation domain-containing protein [Acidobacteriota bacterium]
MNETQNSPGKLTTTEYAGDNLLAFPLSFAQQRLWVLDQLEESSVAYNVPLALRIRGHLLLEALDRVLAEVLRRHEVLRATFEQQNDGPLQIISPAQGVSFPLLDLSHLSELERLSQAQHIAAGEKKQRFDLARGPVFRTRLVKLAADDHVLFITVHHIVCDGWSQRILLRELCMLYEQLALRTAVCLPELPLQYTDFAVWQRKYLSSPRIEEQLKYWTSRLAGAPPALELPNDHPRPSRQSFRGAKFSGSIASDLLRRLEQLSQGEGVTLFMVLLAAFTVLLSRWSGQEDIVLGSPIAGRSRVELENLIGLFVNTLALRTDLSANPSFRELLAQVRETTLGAYAHQDVPFEKIVEALKPERDLSRNPIFQVMFALQNMPKEIATISGLEITPFGNAESTSAKFDLLLTANETTAGMRLAWEYSTDLFEASTIERMHDHFVRLLNGIVENPNQAVSDLPLLAPREREAILIGFNSTQKTFKPDFDLGGLFEQQTERTPGAIAAVAGDRKLSYAELNARANQLARYLRKRGVRPEVLVGISLNRSLDMLVSILAVLKAGGGYVPLDPAYPKSRIQAMLEDSGTAIIITEKSLEEHLPPGRELICLDQESARLHSEPNQNLDGMAEARNLAYVLFTSGSSGRPKGVAVEHRQAANFIQWAQTVFSAEELAGTLFSTSVCFDLSVFEMFAPWSVGGTVILAENILRLPEIARLNRITLLNTVPSAMAELVRSVHLPDSIITINLAGEPLSPVLVADLYSRTGVRHVYNLYGPTEATTYATYTRVESGAEVTIGKPIANAQAYVLDTHLNPVPLGAVGELYLGGAGVARGYIGRPDLTAERFLPDPFASRPEARVYRTGDLCRCRVDGTLEYLGRRDHQVKLRGFRIELGEIESVLERFAPVQQAVAMVADVEREQRLVAYVVAKPGKEVSTAQLRHHAEQHMPAYMVPSIYLLLEKLPLTSNGKVDRRALPTPGVTRQNPAELTPRDEVERMLVKIWTRVLRLPSVGVIENFFELGGHSLLAVRMLAEVRKETGQEIPLATLFQGATVEYLARVLRNGSARQHEMVVPVQPEGSKPPLFGIVVPGANPLGYLALSRHLGKDQPIFEIQGPGPRLRRPYMATEFEALAAEYIRAMKATQPHGPYYLAGMCEGARIAFDMARLLEAAGESVGLLAILDTWVLENSQNRLLWKIDYYSGRLKKFWRRSPAEKWSEVRQWAENRYGSSRPEGLWPQVYWPGKDFVPAKCSAKITVFKIPKQPFFYINDPKLGWGTRTSGEVEVQLVESKHLALLREPYVRALAQKLASCLERVCATTNFEEQNGKALCADAVT